LEYAYIANLVRRSLEEDIGMGDATTEAVVHHKRQPGHTSWPGRHSFALDCRSPKNLPGTRSRGPSRFPHNDGSFVEPGAEILQVKGNARAILGGERTALNFLAHLCGIAR